MESIIYLGIIFGIPTIFCVLCIRNIVEIIKIKKNNNTVEKFLIIETIIFGIVFILIVIFYIWVMFSISRAVANM